MDEPPSVRNDLSGQVSGVVVQAGAIHGNVVLSPGPEYYKQKERARKMRQLRSRRTFGVLWFLLCALIALGGLSIDLTWGFALLCVLPGLLVGLPLVVLNRASLLDAARD
ncbi:hypothetical protein OHU07_23990 [Streptomyces phaeochromogenes]